MCVLYEYIYTVFIYTVYIFYSNSELELEYNAPNVLILNIFIIQNNDHAFTISAI